MVIFETQSLLKLVSRKIWVVEKLWNFHTAMQYLEMFSLILVQFDFMVLSNRFVHNENLIPHWLISHLQKPITSFVCSVLDIDFLCKFNSYLQTRSPCRDGSRFVMLYSIQTNLMFNELKDLHDFKITWFCITPNFGFFLKVKWIILWKKSGN